MPCHMYILFCQLPANSVPTLLSANMGTNSLVSPRCALLVYILTANKNKLITNSFVLYYANIFRQCTASTNVMFVVTQCSLEKLNHLWFGDEYGRVISYCLMNWMLLSLLLANLFLYSAEGFKDLHIRVTLLYFSPLQKKPLLTSNRKASIITPL